ncbi:hypothetical protein NMG60_11028995 [Bertholletia excelsa]
MVCGNAFAKTICSICYEDLKPIVEDLQSISICGHVFHELCLQQWFEYCSKAKKKTCPVCKQTCSEANVGRLYFQSLGDSGLSQKPISCEENPRELRREIERLMGKVSGLSSAVERYQRDVIELREELSVSKEQAKKEAESKNEALQQKASMQQLLHLTAGELNKSTMECMKLQERNMALAKELAALKLATDLNLEEDEIHKLAALGNEANHKDMIDILKKTLMIRNKSYKELMAKCNLLGRGEARSIHKLEKAKEKITKLKTRIREMETTAEVKDNEVLRGLKASKRDAQEEDILNDGKRNSNASFICKGADQHLEGQRINMDQNASMGSDIPNSRKVKKLKPSIDVGVTDTNDDQITNALDKRRDYIIIEDAIAPEVSTIMHGSFEPDLKPQISEELAAWENCLRRSDVTTEIKDEVHRKGNKDEISGPRSDGDINNLQPRSITKEKEIVLSFDDIKQVQSCINTEQEISHPFRIFQPGDPCFSGGLLGPDGTKRHLGKWCKRVQDKGLTGFPVSTQGSSACSSNLIAVGPDGKGGKIKVLRPLNQSSLEGRESSPWLKKCRTGPKTGIVQSRGCLQIEHFFGRAGQ